MKQKKIFPVTRLPLQGLLIYTLVLLLAISLSSFFPRNQHVQATKRSDRLIIEQLHETKKKGNIFVGVVSLTLGLVALTISTGLAAGRPHTE